MGKKYQRIELNVLGVPPVKHPASNQKERNKRRQVKLRQEALNETRRIDWPVNLYEKRMKLTIFYNRRQANIDSANIIEGIADALEGPCYHNDDQLVEIHYSEQVKSRKKKYKRDRYQVILEPVDISKDAVQS